MALSPILDLPVRWQVMGVDVESLAPSKGFAADVYDVANVNAVIEVENSEAKKVELVCPFPTEDAYAEIRVLSSGEKAVFKAHHGDPQDLIPLLRAMGEIPADQQPLLEEIAKATKGFSTATIEVPAGTQVLRFHARQQLMPIEGNPRSYQLIFFAPLAGFILAPSGQSQMSVTVAFAPPWAAPGLTFGTPVASAVPGQPAPETTVGGPTPVAERPIFGAVWHKDPKVTIPYTYAQ